MPANAGIQNILKIMDPGVRRDDGKSVSRTFYGDVTFGMHAVHGESLSIKTAACDPVILTECHALSPTRMGTVLKDIEKDIGSMVNTFHPVGCHSAASVCQGAPSLPCAIVQSIAVTPESSIPLGRRFRTLFRRSACELRLT